MDNLNNSNNAFSPKVSIVIPVYNGSDYLKEAIDSALAQTYKDIEIIVINDGSFDNGETERIALSYGGGIRYFYKDNGGTASALNEGIRQMQGEYFSWLSHDDLYYQEKIEAQVNFLKSIEDKETILYSNFSYIDQYSKVLSNYYAKHVPPEHFRPAFIWGGLINGCTILVPKKCFDAYGVFNESLRTTQDYDLWFRLSEKCSFVHMHEILIKTRLHSNQGTISMKPIVKTEGDNLYFHFINQIKINEINLFYEKPVPIFYIDYALFMLELQLKKAGNSALFLALISFYMLKTRYVKEYLGKLVNAIKINISNLLRTLKTKIRLSVSS